jgi:hypothetical protein
MLCKGIEEDFEQEVNIIKLEMAVDEHALQRLSPSDSESHFLQCYRSLTFTLIPPTTELWP